MCVGGAGKDWNICDGGRGKRCCVINGNCVLEWISMLERLEDVCWEGWKILEGRKRCTEKALF